MAVRKIETQLALTGEREFNDQMKAVNSNLKTLKSEMALVASEFDGQANSAEALRSKQKVLSEQYDQQKEKCRALAEMLKQAEDAYGDNSAQVDKYKQQLNNAKAQLNKFGTDLESVNKYLGEAEKSGKGAASSIDEFGKQVKEAEKKSSTFGDVLKANLSSELIVSGVRAAADAVKELGKVLADTVIDSAAYADNVLTMSTVTGISTERLQEMMYAAELLDVSADTQASTMSKLTRNMYQAKDGTGQQAEAFAALGVEITNADGALRNNQEVFGEIIDRLGEMSNETERDAIAMTLMGKSAQELNPLIEAGSAAVLGFYQEAHEFNAVLNQETLESLGAVDDALQRFNGALSASKNVLGAEFAEPVKTILGGLTAMLKGNTDDGIAIIELGLDQLGKVLEGLEPLAEQTVETLVGTIIGKLPDVVDAGCELVVSLLDGIGQKEPEMLPRVIDLVTTIAETLIDNAPEIAEAAAKLVGTLAISLVESAPELMEKVPQLVVSIAQGLIEGIPKIADVGLQIVQGLWSGISENRRWLRDKLKQWTDGVLSDIKGFFGIASPSKVFRDEIGKNLAAGIGVGFEKEMSDVQKIMRGAIPTKFDPMKFMEENKSVIRTAQTVRVENVPELEMANRETAANGGVIEVHTTLEIDKNKVGEAVTQYQIERERARGYHF